MRVLTLNSGSSSLKAALYDVNDDSENLLLVANVARIGLAGGNLSIRDAQGETLFEGARDLDDHASALQVLLEWLKAHDDFGQLDAIGHRVVHGGSRYTEPQRVTPEVLDELRSLVPLAPEHMPAAIAGIIAASKRYPDLPQVACFDTAFHAHMPEVAQMYALPREYYDAGVRRFGFHGLSYEYLMHELRRLDVRAADGRIILAHLGNGASMAAVRAGVSVDTSMGFTPLAGLVMGTRSGDVDPGALIYLQKAKGLTADQLDMMLNKQSGLLGISGLSADMKDLLDKETSDPRAAEAIASFCYVAKKYVGAYAATLAGLDVLVFTGGIGEKGAAVRWCICDGLQFLGIELDAERNDANAPAISRDGSRVTVRVIKTDEDLMIARHTKHLLSAHAQSSI